VTITPAVPTPCASPPQRWKHLPVVPDWDTDAAPRAQRQAARICYAFCPRLEACWRWVVEEAGPSVSGVVAGTTDAQRELMFRRPGARVPSIDAAAGLDLRQRFHEGTEAERDDVLDRFYEHPHEVVAATLGISVRELSSAKTNRNHRRRPAPEVDDTGAEIIHLPEPEQDHAQTA
jgi:hypothetical protein